REATRHAISRARKDSLPFFLEAKTYRFRGHSVADPATYRTKEEVQKWMERDPIGILAERIRTLGIATEEQLGRSTTRPRRRCRTPSVSPRSRRCPRPNRSRTTSMPEPRIISFREALRE